MFLNLIMYISYNNELRKGNLMETLQSSNQIINDHRRMKAESSNASLNTLDFLRIKAGWLLYILAIPTNQYVYQLPSMHVISYIRLAIT